MALSSKIKMKNDSLINYCYVMSHPCGCVGLLVMVCEVFPPGSNDYEAMASLGRMVAQCGPGIEDIVRQRKPQDPSLWYEGSQRSTRLSPCHSINFYYYQLLFA